MDIQDVSSLLVGYFIFCVGVFLYSLLTAHEDTVIMRNSSDPNYPSIFTWNKDALLIFASMLFFSFCPLLNIVLMWQTYLYRRGLL